jgi:hypothetical protein
MRRLEGAVLVCVGGATALREPAAKAAVTTEATSCSAGPVVQAATLWPAVIIAGAEAAAAW